jgi:holo-[acyl-carrier protein] synthase
LIFGIGTDIIEVSRIESQILKDKGFKERIFTPQEIAYCEKRQTKAYSYAARFAVKEAFFKAIGTGWRGGLGYKEIEVVNDELGKPDVVLHGRVKAFAEQNGIKNIKVSLSHVKEFANAVVLIEK